MPNVPSDYAPVGNTGYNAYIGPIYMRNAQVGAEDAYFLFDVQPHHLNSAGTTHGGVLMSVMDTSCGAAVAQMVDANGSTISLNCDFLSGGRSGDRIEVFAQVTKRTKTVAFVEGKLEVGGKTLLTARGIWRIFAKRAVS